MAIVKMKRLGLLAMRGRPGSDTAMRFRAWAVWKSASPHWGPRAMRMPHRQSSCWRASLRRIDGPSPMRRRATTTDSAPWKCCGMMARNGAVFFRRSPAPAGDEPYARQAMAQRRRAAVADVLVRGRPGSEPPCWRSRKSWPHSALSLAPWVGLDGARGGRPSTPDMPAGVAAPRLGGAGKRPPRAVQNASELACLTQASASRELRYCLLVCRSSVQDAVLEALRGFGWARMDLSGCEVAQPGRATGPFVPQQAQVRAGLEQGPRAAGRHARPNGRIVPRIRQGLCRHIHLQESRALLRDTRRAFFCRARAPAGRWEEVQAALASTPVRGKLLTRRKASTRRCRCSRKTTGSPGR